MAWPKPSEVSLESRSIRAGIALSRVIEVAGGMGAALWGLSLYVYIATKDAAIKTAYEPSNRSVAVAFLMLVVPGVVMAAGSYLQALRLKPWGSGLVLMGAVPQFYWVLPSAWFVFAYSGDVWGQMAVLVGLIVAILTLATSFINLMGALVLNKST